MVKQLVENIDATELSANDIAKKLTLLDAMHMLTRAWSSVTPETIKNCFRKAGFTNGNETSSQTITPVDAVDHPDTMTATSFEEYVRHDEDLECHGMMTDADICRGVQGERQTVQEPLDEAAEDDEIRMPGCISDARDGLAAVRRYLEDHDCKSYSQFYALEELVEKIAAESKRQARMTEFGQWMP